MQMWVIVRTGVIPSFRVGVSFRDCNLALANYKLGFSIAD